MPAGVVTVTSKVPADDDAGVLAVIWVEETTVKPPTDVVPMWRALAPRKPDPVAVTGVEPVSGPASGLTALTDGTAS